MVIPFIEVGDTTGTVGTGPDLIIAADPVEAPLLPACGWYFDIRDRFSSCKPEIQSMITNFFTLPRSTDYNDKNP